jgi:N4-gp56 family major capsid protein
MDTQILAANRLTESNWSTTLFEYMLQNMQFSKMLGTGGKNVFEVDKALVTNAGKEVIMKLRTPFTGEGGGDDSDIDPEASEYWNFSVNVHERNNGWKSKGKMTEQYTRINMLRDALVGLGDWATEKFENDLMYALCGLGNAGLPASEDASSNIKTVNAHAPSTSRIIFGGQTNAGVAQYTTSASLLGAGGASDYAAWLFGTKVIDAMRIRAQLASPKFKPIKINGKGYYVLFIHPLQGMDLQYDANWLAAQKDANVRGLMNPIFGKQGGNGDEMLRMFDGCKGIWNDVIVYESERLPSRITGESFDNPNTATNLISSHIASGTARVCRAVLCGAQAGCVAWAQSWQKHEDKVDVNRKAIVGIDGIYGVSKTVWNDPGADQDTNTPQQDFASIVADTCATER